MSTAQPYAYAVGQQVRWRVYPQHAYLVAWRTRRWHPRVRHEFQAVYGIIRAEDADEPLRLCWHADEDDLTAFILESEATP